MWRFFLDSFNFDRQRSQSALYDLICIVDSLELGFTGTAIGTADGEEMVEPHVRLAIPLRV